MSQSIDTAAKYMLVYLLKKEIESLEKGLKGTFTDGTEQEKAMRPGERKAVVVVLPNGTEVELGALTRTKPSAGWVVSNREDFEAWAKENRAEQLTTETSIHPAFKKDALEFIAEQHPEWLATETVVPEWLVKSTLDSLADTEQPINKDGELIDGVEYKTGTSYVSPKPEKDAVEKLKALVADGSFKLGQLLEVEA